MSDHLKGLSGGVRGLLTEDFLAGRLERLDVSGFTIDPIFNRQPELPPRVVLEPLRAVVNEAIRKFRDNRAASDPWLAPRVHATLRLTRREASDRRVWDFLTVEALPEYVRWRFAKRDDGAVLTLDRFVGESRNALRRLWWGAELTRNGKEYTLTEKAHGNFTALETYWLNLDVFHHRPGALALSRYLGTLNNGNPMERGQDLIFSKAVNLALSTVCLDALADNPPIDTIAVREWCAQEPDHTTMMSRMPEGPDEEPVPEESINRVEQFLRRLADEIDLTGAKRLSQVVTEKAGLA